MQDAYANTHTDSAPQGSQIQKRGGVRSIPEYTIAGISPQDDKAVLWNYGKYITERTFSDFIGALLTFVALSRSHVAPHRVPTSCLDEDTFNELPEL